MTFKTQKGRSSLVTMATEKSVNAHDTRLAYSMREAAESIGVSEKTISNWIRDGRLKAAKIDRTVRIPRESLLALLNGGDA